MNNTQARRLIRAAKPNPNFLTPEVVRYGDIDDQPFEISKSQGEGLAHFMWAAQRHRWAGSAQRHSDDAGPEPGYADFGVTFIGECGDFSKGGFTSLEETETYLQEIRELI